MKREISSNKTMMLGVLYSKLCKIELGNYLRGKVERYIMIEFEIILDVDSIGTYLYGPLQTPGKAPCRRISCIIISFVTHLTSCIS